MVFSLLGYLRDAGFIEENQLLAQVGIDATQLSQYQQQRCCPMPSYRVQLAGQVTSFFGEQSLTEEIRYYPKGMPFWLGVIQQFSDEQAVKQYFINAYQQAAQALIADSQYPDIDEGLLATVDLANVWQHFLKGTYGVCTTNALPDIIARKTLAARAIDKHLNGATVDTAVLHRLIDLLDAVAAEFAPHERPQSSRQRLVTELRQRYPLNAQR